MRYLLVLLCIPPVILAFRHTEKIEILLQFLIIMGLLFLGKKLLGIFGCLKIFGLALIILGIAGYYFLMIQPIFTREIANYNILEYFQK